MHKVFRRYIVSIIAYLIYIIYAILKIKNLCKFYKLRNRVIHVVCPGPTAKNIVNSNVGKNDLIFFINHGVQLANFFENHKYLYSFTIDGLRAYEILKYSCSKNIKVKNIFLPHHFFHFKNLSIFKCIDIFLFPIVVFDYDYGITVNSKSVMDFKSNIYRFSSFGFGSLNAFLLISLNLSPSKIKFYGCDFGKKNNVLYVFDSINSFNVDHPFTLMSEEFKILTNKLINEGVEIEIVT